MCSDLRARFAEHNRGESNFTNRGKPWTMIYYQAFSNKKDARAEELFLKTGMGRQRLAVCLKETMGELNKDREV